MQYNKSSEDIVLLLSISMFAFCRYHPSRVLWYFFFFSSRRRHTRLQGDWSSDVCSSDLIRRAKETPGVSTSDAEAANATRQPDAPATPAGSGSGASSCRSEPSSTISITSDRKSVV